MAALFLILIFVVLYRTIIELSLFYIHLETILYKSILALRKVGTLLVTFFFLFALSRVLKSHADAVEKIKEYRMLMKNNPDLSRSHLSLSNTNTYLSQQRAASSFIGIGGDASQKSTYFSPKSHERKLFEGTMRTNEYLAIQTQEETLETETYINKQTMIFE